MIWRRDMVRLWRQRSRLLGSVARALVWLFALGFGLRGSLGSIAGFSYEQFVFPGVIAMTVIFSGLQSAISIVQDLTSPYWGTIATHDIPYNWVCLRNS